LASSIAASEQWPVKHFAAWQTKSLRAALVQEPCGASDCGTVIYAMAARADRDNGPICRQNLKEIFREIGEVLPCVLL
jgi:hypothetical protein